MLDPLRTPGKADPPCSTMPYHRSVPHRISSVIALLALLVSAGCGTGSPAGRGADEPASRIEHLKSLGYVSWDEGADTSLSGVTLFDETLASPGYNFYTDDVDKVFLTDLRGRAVREWHLPPGKRQCEYAVLLGDGGLVAECVDQSVTRIGPSSEVIWDLPFPAHHDIAPLADGSFLVPYLEDREYRGRQVGFDGIAKIDASGRPSKLWSSFEKLAELRPYHSGSKLDVPPGSAGDPLKGWEQGFEYFHLNSVQVLPRTPLGERDRRFRAGNLLICLRNMNLLVVLDQDGLGVTWNWGGDELDLPHMPRMLPDGHILLFDNGTYRGWSRVLEIEPESGRIVWSYEGTPRESFFSKWRGSAQRLPNGDTLICESERGHVIEVTPEKKIVWEFWNPEIVGTKRKRIYRFARLDPSVVKPLLPQGSANQPGDGGSR